MATHANACHLLDAALTIAPEATHPRRPFHMGGPPPKIDAYGYVYAALWLAELAEPDVDARDAEGFRASVDAAKRQLRRAKEERLQNPDTTTLRTSDAKKVSRIPAKIGAWAAHEALNWSTRPIYAGGAARPSAANYVRHLMKRAPDRVAVFLAELDRRCLHFELLSVLYDREMTTSADIKTTLWRGHKDDKVTHWLMRLANDSFALVFKEKTRWRLCEGSRDDVLAHINGEQLESAVRALFSS